MKTKKVLVVIDMQNDFCSIGGSLANPETIAVVPNVVNKINEYKQNGWIIYATQDTHEANYLETQEGKKLPVYHCIKNTTGWELHPLVKQALGDESDIFSKDTFGSTNLIYNIEIENIIFSDEDYDALEVEYVGICTDICVISNAILHKAIAPETIVKVDSNCCAGTTPEKHKAALEVMKSCQVEVI